MTDKPTPMTPGRALELQAKYALERRATRDRLGIAHTAGDRHSTATK